MQVVEEMRRIGIIWLCMLLILSSSIPLVNFTEEAEAKIVVKDGMTYTSHSSIRIDGNADFIPANGVTGGSGTMGDPWVIDGWDIDGYTDGFCIYIGNTTEYFVIRNCSFYDAGGTGDSMSYYSAVPIINCTNGQIYNNSIRDIWNSGIILYYSSKIIISNNNFTDTKTSFYRGIYLSWSLDIEVYNNAFWKTGIIISGVGEEYYNSHTISLNNSINGKVIYYYKNQSNVAVPLDCGQLILVNCTNFTIQNLDLSNGSEGLCLVYSDFNVITNNNFYNNVDGLYLRKSDNNVILNNTFQNRVGENVYFYNASNNLFRDNKLQATSLYIFYGMVIHDFSNNNEISNNSISGAYTGIKIDKADVNTIRNNTISNNSKGIQFIGSTNNNMIYHNNFVNNNLHVDGTGANQFDNGYPSGGNYWDNYTGSDLQSGPLQDQPGSDGIGDTPYVWCSPVDNYPLMMPAFDHIEPISTVNDVVSYWQTSSNLAVNSTAYDEYPGEITNVTLWYRYSSDNSSWGGWTTFGLDSSEPWSWTFDFPDGEGFYEFFSIANDTANNTEVMKNTAEARCGHDTTAPSSLVDPIIPYYRSTSSYLVNATASDIDGGGAVNATLWFRHSLDNLTWTSWTRFMIDEISPWGWLFNFPNGAGYYEFYSIANDTANNMESPPATADTSCVYDRLLPIITDNSPITGTTGESYIFLVEAFDNLDLAEVSVTYWYAAGSEIIATMSSTTGNNFELEIIIPDNAATLYYCLVVVDVAGNSNSTYQKAVNIEDNDAPVANAGLDRTVIKGTVVSLDGSGSTDNIGIVDYAWDFDDGHNSLDGVNPSFNFVVVRNYTITLTVFDAEGNSDTDTIIISVLIDTDGDGIPDDTDTDDDNDGVPDVDDDLPLDASEDTDTDGDGKGNNADDDDDNDGYLDEWEEYMGTNSTDPNDTPLDTDNDGKPDGDADNTETWMDSDDDGDGVPDGVDADPLDPDITEVIDDADVVDDGSFNYLWIVIILILAVLSGLLIFKRKPASAPEVEEEPPVEEELSKDNTRT